MVAWLAALTPTDVGTGGRLVQSNQTVTMTGIVVAPPEIGGTQPDQGVPSGATDTPFATVTITDPSPAATDTVTVTLSNPSGGALSDSAGGSYGPTTGVYSVSGTPTRVTSDVDALVFTPSAASSSDLSTTDFTIAVTGPGGSASDSSTSVTWVKQVLGLAAIPTGDIVTSVSPDGSSFAAATPGETNEAVVLDPSPGGTYTLPTGYQAEFLGSTVELDPRSVGRQRIAGRQLRR